MEKNKQSGWEVKDMEFSGTWRSSKWVFQGLIKNNVAFSGRDQEEIMWIFQESRF